MKLYQSVIASALVAVAISGCATSAAQEQRNAQMHQTNSDDAAAKGHYGIAGDEQRKAADSHHQAVMKAIDEGAEIPPQTQPSGK